MNALLEQGSVTRAAAALNVLASEPVDVLVSDIGMPDEDGYSMIRRVRQLCADQHLPAIALTAYARKQDAEAALSAGYDHHLPKPVAPAELIKAIKSVTGVSA